MGQLASLGSTSATKSDLFAWVQRRLTNIKALDAETVQHGRAQTLRSAELVRALAVTFSGTVQVLCSV